ncbi:MAG TPA: polysaccharide deacetylase family protein [Myxococcales bacterium]|nr:polysaccharide deacetylase family protein [Myxococcales bacterium]
MNRLLCALLVVACRPAPPPIEMAITFDDLPRHSPLPGQSELEVHRALLAALKAHGVPQVYGFVNGAKLELHPEDRAALAAWTEAGYPLGSHTYSHPEPADVTAYLADIDRNEPLLRELMPGDESRWKVFRYPYLMEGNTLADRAAIRAHLRERGYRIAEVSVDFGDWAWNEPYARCLAKGDQAAIAELKASYLQAALVLLAFDDSFARRLLGRRIRHILLMHVGPFDAIMLDQLLTLYEKEGVRFIPFEEALQDEVYRLDPKAAPTRGDTIEDQVFIERQTPVIPWAQEPIKALDKMCR